MMAAAKGYSFAGDIAMETARGSGTTKRRGFKGWERELLESPEVRRKATVAQLCKSTKHGVLVDVEPR